MGMLLRRRRRRRRRIVLWSTYLKLEELKECKEDHNSKNSVYIK